MTACITAIEKDSTEMLEPLFARDDIDVIIITKNKTVAKYIKNGWEWWKSIPSSSNNKMAII